VLTEPLQVSEGVGSKVDRRRTQLQVMFVGALHEYYKIGLGLFFSAGGLRFVIDAFLSKSFTLSGLGVRDPDGPPAGPIHRIAMLVAGCAFLFVGILLVADRL
jgi:hypothetical protein